MPATTRSALSSQLPRYSPWTFERILNLGGGIASLAALALIFFSIDKLSNDTKIIIAMSYLFAIIVFLICYLMVITRRSLYRYSQAVFHTHFVNHVVRDYMASQASGDSSFPLRECLGQILDSIAACYSVLAGRTCRVSIKEVKTTLEVATVARDTISASSVPSSTDVVHTLDENTDFRNLWYCLDGCSRYFHCPNLLYEWKTHNYNNTSFKIHGDPEVKSILGISMVVKWRLPYKSTIVFPIRYVRDWTKWPLFPGGGTRVVTSPHAPPDVWGFLCIDSASTGVFRLPHAAEVGGAFADALYVLFSYSKAKQSDSQTEL